MADNCVDPERMEAKRMRLDSGEGDHLDLNTEHSFKVGLDGSFFPHILICFNKGCFLWKFKYKQLGSEFILGWG